MEIKIGLIDEFRFIVTDITRSSISNLPSNIYSIELSILSDKLFGGKAIKINLLDYMYVNQIDGELCIIDSNMLGLGKTVRIPDGTYTFIVNVNNIQESADSILVVTKIQEEIKKLDEVIPIDLVATDEYIRNIQLTDDMLHYYYAMSLYVKLINLTSIEYNSKDANILLLQLNRVLSMIDVNNFRI